MTLIEYKGGPAALIASLLNSGFMLVKNIRGSNRVIFVLKQFFVSREDVV